MIVDETESVTNSPPWMTRTSRQNLEEDGSSGYILYCTVVELTVQPRVRRAERGVTKADIPSHGSDIIPGPDSDMPGQW